jgi:hypothetical protein
MPNLLPPLNLFGKSESPKRKKSHTGISIGKSEIQSQKVPKIVSPNWEKYQLGKV